MDSEEKIKLDQRFDTRIISLYSRGIQDGIPRTNDAHLFYSFCYYDAIQVTKVNIGNGPVLRSAYFQALQNSSTPVARLDSQQFLVAVVDILPEQGDTGNQCHGYTAKELEDFWEKSRTAPLFFVSLINLKNVTDLNAVLENIQAKLPAQEGHLAYLTFDHCDLILFSYGESFHTYTKQIFHLCFGCERVLDDVITIYGFNPACKLSKFQEQFRALIRIGVRDFPTALSFQERVNKLPHQVSYDLLLGRNDISLLCKDATLEWLAGVRRALIEEEDLHTKSARWYTTYDLTVFASNSFESKDTWYPYGSGITCKNLELCITQAYKDFETCYYETFQRLQREQNLSLTPNEVWLRWLKDSCRLVVSLMGSRLSMDLATCLVPQFLDLLKYGKKLFMSDRLNQRSQIDHIHKSFSTFFSNIAILVDSMNQTNRQFVQVPAFHLPSFNLPPQLLAYYMVLSQSLREVLQDDEETIYGLAISPNLSNILNVSSLAVQESLPNHQWLSIRIDEPSFYTLKMTTETFAHEISHFIGQDNRERKIRKRCILQCAFQIYFWNILNRLFNRVNQYYGHLADQSAKIQSPSFNMVELEKIAERLLSATVEIYGEYQEDEHNFSRDLDQLLRGIPYCICDSPQLLNKVFEEIWSLKEAHPKCFQPVIDTLHKSLDQLNGGPILQEAILKKQIEVMYHDVLKDMSREFTIADLTQDSSSELCQLIGKLCYMFQETFADLQAILLLEMDWKDYAQLLSQNPQREQGTTIIEDCPLRMLAVANVLLKSGVWTVASLTGGGDALKSVESCIGLDCRRAPTKLIKNKFNPTFLLYLTEYLAACEDRIKRSFADEIREAKIKTLRELHESLSDETSIFELQNTLSLFIEKYRMKLLNSNLKDDENAHKQKELCAATAGQT